MELADPRLISQLTEFQERRPRRLTGARRKHKTDGADACGYTAPIQKSRRCRCGNCGPCKDNQRWERIFAEKFADPTYYSNLVIRRGSPLHTE